MLIVEIYSDHTVNVTTGYPSMDQYLEEVVDTMREVFEEDNCGEQFDPFVVTDGDWTFWGCEGSEYCGFCKAIEHQDASKYANMSDEEVEEIINRMHQVLRNN